MDTAWLEMMSGLPLVTQRTMLGLAVPGLWDLPPADQEARLRERLAGLDLTPLREKLAATLVRETGLAGAVPERHAEFRPVVEDGVARLLAELGEERFLDLLLEQVLLPPDSGAGERLLCLAARLPCLWKLGQVIARRPGLDPALRDLLGRLENGIRQTPPAAARARAAAALGPWEDLCEFDLADGVLAEGSVGVVLALRWRPRGNAGSPWREAVVKLVKPEAAARLPEEMALLDGIALFLEGRRERYSLGDLAFRDTFREVRDALAREMDLPREQQNLREAGRFYRELAPGAVPEVLPFSSPGMTVMSRLPGGKVTDRPAPPDLDPGIPPEGPGRRGESSVFRMPDGPAARVPEIPSDGPEARGGTSVPPMAMGQTVLAGHLFRLLILEPLFSPDEVAVFHGDPHAGNLFCDARDRTAPQPGFLDWSQAGHLGRAAREALVQVAMGTMTDDPGRVLAAVRRLRAAGPAGPAGAEPTPAMTAAALAEALADRSSWLGRAVAVVDGLLRRGVAFPQDLLLLRKSLFTLEGVLAELDPGFDQDVALREFLVGLVGKELPARWVGLAMPWWDRPSRYRSLVSNLDLQALLHRLGLETLRWSLGQPMRWWPSWDSPSPEGAAVMA
ncbi:MAG: hypothetical protein GX442_07410 [Candidatus Riflebacteria bacterium]|nr:hypothetical protein [Candidatus Riflebacteria bacterium]